MSENAILEPNRFRIAIYIWNHEAYVYQISEALRISPRLTSHHLDILEKHGLIKSDYRLVESGKHRKVAARFILPTNDLKDAFEVLREFLAS